MKKEHIARELVKLAKRLVPAKTAAVRVAGREVEIRYDSYGSTKERLVTIALNEAEEDFGAEERGEWFEGDETVTAIAFPSNSAKRKWMKENERHFSYNDIAIEG